MNYYIIIPAALVAMTATYYLITRYKIVRRDPPKSLAQQLAEALAREGYREAGRIDSKMRVK